MNRQFYFDEWKLAEEKGNIKYANSMKEMYRELTMQMLTKEYHQRDDRLKMFPLINLN